MKTVLILTALSVVLAGTTAAGAAGIGHVQGIAALGHASPPFPAAPGAGNISYLLRLKNVSKTSCSVTGLPQGRLLGRHGGVLSTNIRAAFPGALSATLVTLRPGQSARATARFSPDVPGTGEQTIGAVRADRVPSCASRPAVVERPRCTSCRRPRSASTAGLLFSAYGR